MAKSKADLIEEATKQGLTLTGDETAADLRKLLNDVNEGDGEDTPQGPTVEEQAVTDAAARVAAARKVLDEAIVEHDAAKAAHAETVRQPDPEFGVHYQIEGNSSRGVLPKEFGGQYPYRLTLDGQNYEHVSDHPVTGAWIYRQM